MVYDLVVGIVDQCGQVDVEDDFGEWVFQFFGFDVGCVGVFDQWWYQVFVGGVGEVVIDQWIIVDVDLGGQFVMVVCCDEEVDVCWMVVVVV